MLLPEPKTSSSASADPSANPSNKTNLQQIKIRLTNSNIALGTLRIRGRNHKFFAGGNQSRKIEAFFENKENSIFLVYSPKNNLIYGLTGWYREHNAQPGDMITITVLERKRKYGFTFDESPRQKSPASFLMKSPLKDGQRSLVGSPINFRGIVYGPINEQGVVFLFSKIHDELGIKIEAVQQGFPDARARRFNGKGWIVENIEFEYKSSHFIQHGHNLDECDIIVCWKHDWKDCPLEVIEMRSLIKKLPNSLP